VLPDLEALGRWDGRLRQVAAGRSGVENAAAAARERLGSAADDRERARLHGYLGNAARMLGRDADAVAELERSLELATELGDLDLVAVATIRLAEAHRCFDRFDRAEALLRSALDLGPRRDFALQHLGKTLVDAGRPAEGVPLLEEALELRLATADAELIESTRLALDRARALLQ
jgi:tetratricopeptide (TPR) repeat protein